MTSAAITCISTSQVGEDEEPFALPYELLKVPLLHIVF
jgi:hypothetical protein